MTRRCGHLDVREFDVVAGWHHVDASVARQGVCGPNGKLWEEHEPLPGARSLATIYGVAILVSIAIWWWCHG